MSKYAVYQNAAPYFDLVRGALGDLVDGKHFFDIITDDIIYEVLYDIPGWPRVIKGRPDLMAAFRGYVGNIALRSANELILHKTDDGRVVIIEYEVHGTVVATSVKYDNRFCSIIKIESRKIAHWRDYMDSLAAWNAPDREGMTPDRLE
jgi:ketosteroid isomerase-like protein